MQSGRADEWKGTGAAGAGDGRGTAQSSGAPLTPSPACVRPHSPSSTLVLGVDPGVLNTGYAFLAEGPGGIELGERGVIATRSDDDLGLRLGQIYDAMRGLLSRCKPGMMVLEDLYSDYKFPRTAIQMGHARGVVWLAAYQEQVPVVALGAAEVKRALTGNGRAGKEQVQDSINRLLGLNSAPYPDHVSDAMALAFTAISRRSALGRMLGATGQPRGRA